MPPRLSSGYKRPKWSWDGYWQRAVPMPLHTVRSWPGYRRALDHEIEKSRSGAERSSGPPPVRARPPLLGLISRFEATTGIEPV
jgi:hypothetical protein